MERVGFSEDVIEAFKDATRGMDLGHVRHTVGARRYGGSWFALLTALFVALLLGGLTTWAVVGMWAEPEIPFPMYIAFSLGYGSALAALSIGWGKRPGVRHPATWVVLWDGGMAWLAQGGSPVAVYWDEIEEARHTVTSVRDGFGKEFNRTHRLLVVPAPNPVRRAPLYLEPAFPEVERLAHFVADRAPAA
ncbi:hypothetical protein ACH4MA_11785 [Streptomyces roseolus]|uniref:hypothetical protein n=1 Tax=Streptomyces roseolus TaxID=67358 RepID=UPI0037944FF4